MNFNLNLISDFNLDLLKRVIESKNISEINTVNTSPYGQLYQSIFSFEEGLKKNIEWFEDNWDIIKSLSDFPPGMSSAVRISELSKKR